MYMKAICYNLAWTLALLILLISYVIYIQDGMAETWRKIGELKRENQQMSREAKKFETL